MSLNLHRLDRIRRTEAVIEVLRRRAAQRGAQGQDVPPALRAAIADFDRHLASGAVKPADPPRTKPR